MPSKIPKKPVKKAVAAKKAPVKKKVTAVKPAAKAKTTVKKPVSKTTTTKKVITKKAVAKKVAPKKVLAKKAVTKSAVKKPIAKTAAKKAIVKKTVAKKAPVKTAVKAKPKKLVSVKKAAPAKTAKKAAAKSTVKKPQLKIVPKAAASKPKAAAPVLKKPLAPLTKTAVKTTPAVREITPIRAQPPVIAKPRPTTDSKADMTTPNVPTDYEPTDTEEFMNPIMKEYFRHRLFAWRDELLRESEETLHTLSEEGNMQKPDITDRASEETDLAIEFRTRDRERKLLNKINEAIMRIEDDSYGYCEETGDPIPVKRLIARPTATRTLEAEELHERRERTQRDQYE